MTKQVMKIDINSTHLVCIYDFKTCQFKLYSKFWDCGWHRKLISTDLDFRFIMKCAMSYIGCSI